MNEVYIIVNKKCCNKFIKKIVKTSHGGKNEKQDTQMS